MLKETVTKEQVEEILKGSERTRFIIDCKMTTVRIIEVAKLLSILDREPEGFDEFLGDTLIRKSSWEQNYHLLEDDLCEAVGISAEDAKEMKKAIFGRRM